MKSPTAILIEHLKAVDFCLRSDHIDAGCDHSAVAVQVLRRLPRNEAAGALDRPSEAGLHGVRLAVLCTCGQALTRVRSDQMGDLISSHAAGLGLRTSRFQSGGSIPPSGQVDVVWRRNAKPLSASMPARQQADRNLGGNRGTGQFFVFDSSTPEPLDEESMRKPAIAVKEDGNGARGRSSRFWGRHMWARGYFVATSGNVTDEVVQEYIRLQGQEPPEDQNFRVEPG